MGVCPAGAQVRTTLGMSIKPDSSAKTMWAPSRAAFFYARPVLLLPALDLVFIPLHSAPFRFLHAPSEAVQQTADMIAVILDRELAADQFGNAGRGPQIGSPAMRRGSLEKQTNQALALSGIQLAGTARRKTHFKSLRATSATGVAPTHHGNCRTANTPPHLVQRITSIQQSQRTLAPVFQKISATLRSGHRCSGEEPEHLHIVTLFMQK